MFQYRSDIGYLLNKLNQCANNQLAKLLRSAGVQDITPGLGRILFVLWEKDGINMNELAKDTNLDKSTMTNMIDRLEKNGLVRREPDTTDRRGILIKLTEQSFAKKEMYENVAKQLNRRILAGIDQDNLNTTILVLQKMFDNLQS